MGFVVGHLIGNLQIFLGQEPLNVYAEKLQSLGELLWVIRGGLLLVIVAHIVTTVLLAVQNSAARPQKYAVKKSVRSSAASKTMLLSGLTVLAFIIFHLAHFTAKSIHPEWKNLHDAAGRHDVYSMVILGFQNPLVSGFYIIAICLLCLHMTHGIQSFLQTLGGRTKKLADGLSKASPAISWAIFAGYASIPTAVLLGILKLPNGH
jgi:succinate dehydrogenase / fumarate reductase cytochrome b subunit